MDKIIATTMDGDILIFDSAEDYEAYQTKLMKEIFDNAFTTNSYEEE